MAAAAFEPATFLHARRRYPAAGGGGSSSSKTPPPSASHLPSSTFDISSTFDTPFGSTPFAFGVNAPNASNSATTAAGGPKFVGLEVEMPSPPEPAEGNGNLLLANADDVEKGVDEAAGEKQLVQPTAQVVEEPVC